ncbi:hypothetical protein WDW89_10525 [Deltaproteobacteria bacterium TL4]
MHERIIFESMKIKILTLEFSRLLKGLDSLPLEQFAKDKGRGDSFLMETDAWYLILQHIVHGNYSMMTSTVHFLELEQIKESQERIEVIQLLQNYGSQPVCDVRLGRTRAEELFSKKLGSADAAHIAYAELMADVFISCDDKLIKKCRRLPIHIPAMNPLEFCVSQELQ